MTNPAWPLSSQSFPTRQNINLLEPLNDCIHSKKFGAWLEILSLFCLVFEIKLIQSMLFELHATNHII